MRALVTSSLLLTGTLAFAGTKEIPPPRLDALDLENGAVMVEQPESYTAGVAEWSAYRVTDGSHQGGWCSPEGAPQGASFVWELDTTWQLDTLALSNLGVEERSYPGISTRTVELFVATATGPWTSVGRFSLGKRERRELALPPGTQAARVRLIVLENHGNETYTELSEASVFGHRTATPRAALLDGEFDTNLGLLRLARDGNQLLGCITTDDDAVTMLSGTIAGRLARMSWQVTSSDGTTEGSTMFALSSAGDQLQGVWFRDQHLDSALTGIRVPPARGPRCQPARMPPLVSSR